METDIIYNCDCLEGLSKLPDNSIDMVFTSPPYADRRKSTYGGEGPDGYIEWFLPISSEIKRVLKDTGSFFLNIKPHTINGERSLYVFELVMELRNTTGFMFVDELCWTKNAFPGSYRGRLKNGFEPVYHFTKATPSNITFNPTVCGAPIKQESIERSYRKQCGEPESGSGMTGMNTTNIRHLKMGRASNVVNVNNVVNQFSKNKGHPATFPIKLVDFFIETYSDVGQVILDPFMGSGTTAVSAIGLHRKYIGFEMMKEYHDISMSWIDGMRNTETNDFFD
jgi:site-specific DNA-methyltransferase (adenine-specific)